MPRHVIAAILALAALSSAGCQKQQDCERTMTVVRGNDAALLAFHEQLQRMNPQNTSDRVTAERFKDEIGEVATKAEKLTVETELLRGPVTAYRDALKQAAAAAVETSRHTTTLARTTTAQKKDDATAAAALEEVQSACPRPEPQCAAVTAVLTAPDPPRKPDDLAALAESTKAYRTRLEALKLEDAALARAVGALVRAMTAQEKDAAASHEALQAALASAKISKTGLVSAREARDAIEAICK